MSVLDLIVFSLALFYTSLILIAVGPWLFGDHHQEVQRNHVRGAQGAGMTLTF